jgi:hypothetical protein
MNTTDSRPDNDSNTPLGLGSTEGLGPLPPHRKVTAHGRMWTEADMHAYALQEQTAERERWKALLHEHHRTHNPEDDAYYGSDLCTRTLGALEA